MPFYGPWTYGLNPCTVTLAAHQRPDFYNLLLPRIIEEDQKTGTASYLDEWDNPQAEINAWDQEKPFLAVWDRIGMRPVIQRLFWCMETEHGKVLQEIADMDVLTDPDQCPEKYLPIMAASLGYNLDPALPVAQQRATIRGLFNAYKHRGEPISWTVWFRMLGYRVISYPLWKKEVAEDQDRYARDRYPVTTAFGPIVLAGPFVPSIPQAPLKPLSLVVTDGVETLRDDGRGRFIGTLGGSGVVDYLTGAMQLQFAPPGPAGPITLSGVTVNEEYPYHAARVDFDFFLVPLKGGPPPTVDGEFVKRLLRELEEVRPIHVLIRTFNLVLDLEDTLDAFTTDALGCGPSLGVDHWDGREDYFIGDVGPCAADGALRILADRAFPIPDNEYELVEDRTAFIDPLQGDPLVIISTPAQSHDGSY